MVYTPPGSLDTENPETHEYIPGEWRQERSQGLQPLDQQGSNQHSDSVKEIRDYLWDFLIQKVGQFIGKII